MVQFRLKAPFMGRCDKRRNRRTVNPLQMKHRRFESFSAHQIYRISPKVRHAALNRVKAGQYRHSVPVAIFIHPPFCAVVAQMFSNTICYGMGEGEKDWLMNELDRIREQIKRMRVKGVEPNYVIMCYELWDSLGRPHRFSRVECYPDDGVLGRFEVR